MQTSNLRANQHTINDLSRLIEDGNAKLFDHFTRVLKTETPHSIEPLHFVTKDTPFPVLPQDKLARLGLIYTHFVSQTDGAYNVGIFFNRDEWGSVFRETCKAALYELGRTVRELNAHIKAHLATDCYLAYEVTEILSSLSERVVERTGELKPKFSEILKPIRETAKSSLSELLDDTKRKAGLIQTVLADGSPTPLVAETMQRLQTMVEFLRPISSIMISLGDGGWKANAPSGGWSADAVPSLASFDIGADGRDIFVHYCLDTIDTLLSSLEQKARALRSKATVGVFLANCTVVIERMVRNSDLGPVLGQRLTILEQWRKKATSLYTDVCKDLSIHLFDTIHTNRPQRPASGQADSAFVVRNLSGKDKDKIKEKFLQFNSAFDDMITKHNNFSMEREVRRWFGDDIRQKLQPLYDRFWDRYHEIDKGKGKYVNQSSAWASPPLNRLPIQSRSLPGIKRPVLGQFLGYSKEEPLTMSENEASLVSSPAAPGRLPGPKRKRDPEAESPPNQDLPVDETEACQALASKRIMNSTDASGWEGEWPPPFKALERTHKALNLAYTFCCTRKHLATTFETLKPVVESHIKRPLTIEEVTLVAALRPDGIKFAYVDELALQPDVDVRDTHDAFKLDTSAESMNCIRHPSDSGSVSQDLAHGKGENAKSVLLFEFVDGDLKRQVQNKTANKARSLRRRLRDEALKLPVYDQKHVAQLIEKRNGRFADAIHSFLSSCARQQLEPVLALQCRAETILPKPPSEADGESLQVLGAIPDTIPKERDSIAEIVEQLFTHQAEALNALHRGQNVVVATSTSSGKSLIYQLPTLIALENDCNSRALFIFPTKALAQDQRRSLLEMLALVPGLEDMAVETFDGDTPMSERNFIREEARVILTNPDMLHITILPQEYKWRTFFSNLTLVFVSCSATAANPKQHFETMLGSKNVSLIDCDGSPSGRKEFICWNTPLANPGDPSSGRKSAKSECALLFCALMLRGVRMIAFCRVRAQCEALVGAIREELTSLRRPECANLVMCYRGGYTAADRRMIESDMFDGKLMGIVATTALELGVDIGALDCVMTWGFPYTIANLRQQSGRAGRRNRDSLSILVGDCFPTDQHFMQNPDELFTRPNAELRVDLENMIIREGHVQCAAFEMPIRPEQDSIYFGLDLVTLCKDRLVADETGFFHCHDRFRPNPSKFMAVRDTDPDHFAIVDTTMGRNKVLEELEASRAIFTIYDGAIFLHQGQSYLVKEFLPDKLMAKVEKVKVDWFTTQRDYTDIDPIEIEAIRRISSSSSQVNHGTIRILQKVFGFFKVDKNGRILDAVEVDNPPIIRYSKGMWLDVPEQALEILQARHLNSAAAIHAAEHAVMSLLPTLVVSAPEDLRTECKIAVKEFTTTETQRKRPARLTFYDSKGGPTGSGITAKAFDHIDGLLKLALRRIEACQCRRGCVECVASETCKGANEVMSKAGSQVILKSLLDLEIDIDQLPMGPEECIPAGVETVVLALPVPKRGRV
ncbi:hypothetical protein CDD80_986 [Ophiocordyceps camponoti-rufipedis]|uniref:Helicase C-terminal domain-containing protein n=1 Tax=Ophiocordyceps camponoti-rufipedis TaxID=2004952 RepID=A0A2C5YG49_9HYPO|nr:hypothetical protein CDD80_986 [Ophiocordyceps camponoti-rufipedis]